MPVVLTVAGSDSGGGAGIQADLKTFAACGTYGTSAISALTAQNTRGVTGIEAVSAKFVAGQIAAVLDDFDVGVLKTGMLPSREIICKVADTLRSRPQIRLVLDPVLVTTSGHELAARDVGAVLAQTLFSLATIVTPNLSETAVLLGCEPPSDVREMQDAARAMHALGPASVLIKGGHLNDGETVTDVLYDGTDMHLIAGPRVRTGNTHGTGCTTASAIAAFLARGLPVPAAVRAARRYVTCALQQSRDMQLGTGPQRPFNQLFACDVPSGDAGARDLDLRLYAVTDPGCNQRCGRSSVQAVEAAIAGGATIVQLREKDIEGGRFCAEAEAIISVARPRGVKVIINDRIDVALAVGADGVHVGQGDVPAAAARRLLGPDRILGVSVKTVDQARKAEQDGADYVGAGALYSTTTKDSSRISRETLAAICQAVSIPVVAIGGISADRAAGCIEAGSAGVAVVSAIFGAADPAAAAAEILAAVDLSSRKAVS